MSSKFLSALQTVFTPKKWFKERPELTCEATEVEERQQPVPGVYKHVAGRGWFLATTISYSGKEKVYEPCSPPKRVVYSKVLHRYFFEDDYQSRKTYGRLLDGPPKQQEIGFFRVDDAAWVNCWDHEGHFIPGPYKKYIPDERTKKFRPMTRVDDPNYMKQRKARNSQRLSSQGQKLSVGATEGGQPEFDRSLTDHSCSTGSTAYTNKLWDIDAEGKQNTTTKPSQSRSSVDRSKSDLPSETPDLHVKPPSDN